MTSRGSASCSLAGYPDLALYDGADTVPLAVHRQTAAGFLYQYVPPSPVTIAPGAMASFGIEWINQANIAAISSTITPPNETAVVQLSMPAYEVPASNTVTVTAVAPGAEAGG